MRFGLPHRQLVLGFSDSRDTRKENPGIQKENNKLCERACFSKGQDPKHTSIVAKESTTESRLNRFLAI
jgi:hypothetical protein